MEYTQHPSLTGHFQHATGPEATTARHERDDHSGPVRWEGTPDKCHFLLPGQDSLATSHTHAHAHTCMHMHTRAHTHGSLPPELDLLLAPSHPYFLRFRGHREGVSKCLPASEEGWVRDRRGDKPRSVGASIAPLTIANPPSTAVEPDGRRAWLTDSVQPAKARPPGGG